MKRKSLALLLSGSLVLLTFALGMLAYNRNSAETTKGLASIHRDIFSRAHSPAYGPSTAKVRITEFFDPACETCRAFYPMVKRLVDAEQGRVQLIVRFIPLHVGSDLAAKILIAAEAQKLFWPVTEVLLNSQEAWASHGSPNPELLWELLRASSLDIPRAKDDVTSARVQAIVAQDIADAKTLNVSRTPGFFVNGKPLERFGYDQLNAMVQEELRRNYPR